MLITVHVRTIAEVEEARAMAQAAMQDGDELNIIVAQPVNKPAERQAARQARGVNVEVGS